MSTEWDKAVDDMLFGGAGMGFVRTGFDGDSVVTTHVSLGDVFFLMDDGMRVTNLERVRREAFLADVRPLPALP